MVLHLGDEDLAAIESGFLRGNAVERVGRSLDKDHDLFALVNAEETSDSLARLLVSLGREPRLVSRAAVHAGVEVGELGHHVADPLQRRGAGGVVEVDPGDGSVAVDRHGQLDPGEVLAPSVGIGGRQLVPSLAPAGQKASL